MQGHLPEHGSKEEKMGSDLNAQLRGKDKIYATVEYSAFADF